MNDDTQQPRCVHDRPRTCPNAAHKARREPQNAAVGSPTGRSGPSEAIGGLPNATNRRMIGLRKPAIGESRFRKCLLWRVAA